jgi:hypothetical protein
MPHRPVLVFKAAPKDDHRLMLPESVKPAVLDDLRCALERLEQAKQALHDDDELRQVLAESCCQIEGLCFEIRRER